MNFHETNVNVTPLTAEPNLVLTEIVPAHEQSARTKKSSYPKGTHQMIHTTWSSDIRRPNGDNADNAERQLYRIAIEHADGTREEIAPTTLTELGDNDNNHFLYINTDEPAISVAFPTEHLIDPNLDLNPDTRINIDHNRH